MIPDYVPDTVSTVVPLDPVMQEMVKQVAPLLLERAEWWREQSECVALTLIGTKWERPS